MYLRTTYPRDELWYRRILDVVMFALVLTDQIIVRPTEQIKSKSYNTELPLCDALVHE